MTPPIWVVLSFALIIGATLLLTLLRVIFASLYWETFGLLPWSTLSLAFLHGLRFDWAAACQLVIPAIVIALLYSRWRNVPRLQRAAEILMILPFLIGFLVYGFDIHYFGDSGRRLSYEVFLLRNDWRAVVRMGASYFWTVLLVGALMVVLSWLWLRFAHFVKNRFTSRPPITIQLGWFVFLAVMMVVGLRGGVQSKPLRPSFAYFTTNRSAGQLALNPIFTITYAMRKGKVQVPRFMPQEAAVDRVQSLLRREGWEFPLDNFPLYQMPTKTVTPAVRPNIVVLVLESWSSSHVGALNKGQGFTPRFDALAAQGMLFENFFSIGHRSTDGLTAVCLSLPTFADLQIIGSSLEQNRFRGLGRLLTEQGYSTLFLHGAKIGSMGLNGFARVAGFDRYLGKEDFKLSPGEADRTWGVFDHVALRRLNAEMRSMKEPFCVVWFSLTSHSPYEVPAERYRVTPATVPEHEFMDSLRYSDESIGEFFAAAEKEPYFRNTVFILVADHTAGTQLNGTFERHRIPLLIYSPGRVPAKRISVVGSQLDILPTILDLTKSNAAHHSFGRSLLDTAVDRHAFVDLGSAHGWFTANRLTVIDTTRPVLTYDWKNDPYERQPIANNENVKRDVEAFVQTSKSLVLENRLSP